MTLIRLLIQLQAEDDAFEAQPTDVGKSSFS
jgi:hypothetical protein